MGLVDLDFKKVLERYHDEPSWLSNSRLFSLENLSKFELPKLEKTTIATWNFKDFDFLSNKNFSFHKEQDFLNNKSDLLKNDFLQVNGRTISKNSTFGKGVILEDFLVSCSNYSELVKEYFEQFAITNKLAALHSSFLNGGVFLYVPKNVEIKEPVSVLFFFKGQKVAFSPRILIVVEENSKVDFVCKFYSEEENLFNNGVVQLFLKENAKATFTSLNMFPKNTIDVISSCSYLSNKSELDFYLTNLSQGQVIFKNEVYLTGDYSKANIDALTFGTFQHEGNFTTAVYHEKRNTKSNINARAVVKEEARTVLNSITHIKKGAKQSDGKQKSKVLMVSKQARGDANPILLIDENDVIAGHAASVGKLDPMQLFYLMSRGLTQRVAEKLLIFGFIQEVVSQIKIEGIKSNILDYIDKLI